MLRGDLPRLARATSIMTASASSPIKRSKPLKYAYEKEIVLYAHHKKLDYFSTECIYSPEAFRGSARALIKDLERIRPSAILDVVRSGEDMARCVPPEAGGPSCARNENDAAVIQAETDEGTGGCGSANGRSSGGEMADLEKKLRIEERIEENDLELEINVQKTSTAHPSQQKVGRGDPQIVTSKATKSRGAVRTDKKLNKQQMGKCERCGYISSQAVCKACALLEGLNKNRPRQTVEVGTPEGEIDSALSRSIGRVAIAGGGG